MPVAAVLLAGLSPRALRLLGRVALGERRRLALARSPGVFEQLLQLGDACLASDERLVEGGDHTFEPGDHAPQLDDQLLRRGAVATSGIYIR